MKSTLRELFIVMNEKTASAETFVSAEAVFI
jgi:hypothetical protein